MVELMFGSNSNFTIESTEEGSGLCRQGKDRKMIHHFAQIPLLQP
jgi:hypothetical protein